MPDDELAARIAQAVSVFAYDLGVWDMVLTITPAPGGAPLVQKGIATRSLVGKRWLVVDHRTEFGFEGHGVYGWDANTRRYVGTWVDGQMSSFARSEGTWDAATRTMTYVTEVLHQGRHHRYREITETRDDGTQVYHHLVPTPDGPEHELILGVYTRRMEEGPSGPTGAVKPMSGW